MRRTEIPLRPLAPARHGRGLALIVALAAASLRADPSAPAGEAPAAVALSGEIVDATGGQLLPARLYVEGRDGSWHTVSAPGGRVVPYRKQRGASVEVHTTLPARAFEARLPPGRYTLTAERGKEYHPATVRVELRAGEPARVRLELRRWVDMASLGWYSGETHVHRTMEELPAVMLAEDLNVTFPLLHWVTRAFEAPTSDPTKAGQATADPIRVDATHTILPRNTEYEIFTVGSRRHTLGAFFILNHRTVFRRGVPPVRPIGRTAHEEGALIELDKHAWPWSMALPPLLDVDLYELTNNHVWRCEFLFRDWGEPAAAWMDIERDERGWTERGWIDYGLQNYYALLDCGFRIRPTAGTASGVHPVPLGFGRVYVYLPDGFDSASWCAGLDAGRSFVTTGPMLLSRVDGRLPGAVIHRSGPGEIRVEGRVISEAPPERIEVVAAGRVVATPRPRPRRTEGGAWTCDFSARVRLEDSSWIAARVFEPRPGGRVRFAHGGPVHVEIEGRPLRPRREEVDFLIRRVEIELERSRGVLPPEAIAEYEAALVAYRTIRSRAR